jgi:hypothetical protein
VRATDRAHQPDVVSLIFGLFFLGVAAVWGLSAAPRNPGHGWWLPALLIGVGVVGLLVSLTSRRPAAQQPPQPEPPSEE